jgi:hypothetical protein
MNSCLNSHPLSVRLHGFFNFFIDQGEDYAILKPGNQLKVVGYQK